MDFNTALNTIQNGIYGRDIKEAIYEALSILGSGGSGSGSGSSGGSSSGTYATPRDIHDTDAQQVILWLINEGYIRGTASSSSDDPLDTTINLDKNLVRAFLILARMGLIGGLDTSGTVNGYKNYKYYRSKEGDQVKTTDPNEKGIPDWARPTIYKLMHKRGTDGNPLLNGTGLPITSDVLYEGSNGTNPSFYSNGVEVTDSNKVSLYNVEMNISSEMLRTLVILDRSGYFESIAWCSNACDITTLTPS